MNSVSAEIADLIEKNLPSATAGVMKDFIKEAEKTSEELSKAYKIIANQTNALEKLESSCLEYRTTITEYEDMGVLKSELEDKESKLNIREQKLDLEISNILLQESVARNRAVESLVTKVFGHPSVMVTNRKSIVTPISGSGDCCGYVDERIITDTKTTTESKL